MLFRAFRKPRGTSLAVQWLRLCAPNAGGPGLTPGSIPGQGIRSQMMELRPRAAKKYKNLKNPRVVLTDKFFHLRSCLNSLGSTVLGQRVKESFKRNRGHLGLGQLYWKGVIWVETRRVLTQDWLVVAGWMGGKQKGRSLLYAPCSYLRGSPVSPKAHACL